ncbi:glycine betaine ABC transporter substrate-binding protein [Glutamicibacter protophormiae]|uniref:Osmoprotectant transport system substrate-binding protein n=1 Tax=Glutamicibacter protophormiae TaxID=37930 RepID=A0ABS4XLD2_GLUPR|nr:glycine betaine ABC transporter substrate-binding protein [Glutamicibacter protophormiae]MBP2397309.1 osmoprotectant transport system substrate-binding protein [Glutamicibacter protophormiae]GGL80231.1 glycine/betaine ABC transporter substrate-binding protein [Glutamicibacter protophormiae]
MKRTSKLIALSFAALIGLTGCGLSPSTGTVPASAPGSIQPLPDLPETAKATVTSKSFTEQLLLGKITVIALETAGFDVTDLTNVPGSQPARQLLLSGDASALWEYTGTAWLTYLGHEEPVTGEQAQWQAVHDEDVSNNIVWGEPAPLNNTYALAMNRKNADRLGVTKLSQLKELDKEELTFCVDPEFNSRRDGLTPMLEHYGIDRGKGVSEDNIGLYDVGAIYQATADGACNFGEVFTTDGRIKALDLTVLEDDLDYFPSYNAAPAFNGEFIREFPQAMDVMEQIAPLLTDEALMDMNYQVDVVGREPSDVAFEWMVDQGLVTTP